MKSQLLVLCLAAAASLNAGVILSLSPSAPSIAAGDPFTVDVVIQGIPDGRALGAYTGMTVGFDKNIVTPDLVVVSNRLGDVSDFMQLQYSVNTILDGLVLLDVASLLDTDSLLGLQSSPDGKFVLATMKFSTIGFGKANFLLTPGILADDLGDRLVVDDVLNTAVTVNGGSAVPEPSAVLLLSAGLGAFAVMRRRN